MQSNLVKITAGLKLPGGLTTPAGLAPSKSEFPLRPLDVVRVALALGLVVTHVVRLSIRPEPAGWLWIIAVLIALPAADFVSGFIHWLFDTWGSERTFWIGSRVIYPFRIHHTKPKDLLGTHFFTTNSDAALANLPFLLLAFCIPLGWEAGRLATVFLVALAVWGLPTSQIHKWAHSNRPPRWVTWLQSCGLILSPGHHARHHAAPHTVNYCITTGWCNPLLARLGFFRKLERLVTAVTGWQPRASEPDTTGDAMSEDHG